MKVLAALTAATLAVTATAAFAATNEYDVTFKTSPAKPGSTSKPVPTSLTTGFTLKDATGLRPSPVAKYVQFHAGVRINGKPWATCSPARIAAAGSDSVCPKGSLVGNGTAQARAGFADNPSDQQYKCLLHVKTYNAPNLHQAIYLSATAAECGGTTVNSVLDGKWKNSSKGATLTYSVPRAQNHPVGGVDAATVINTTTIKKLTKKVKGKTVGYAELVGGCKGGKRAYSTTFTSEDGRTVKAAASADC